MQPSLIDLVAGAWYDFVDIAKPATEWLVEALKNEDIAGEQQPDAASHPSYFYTRSAPIDFRPTQYYERARGPATPESESSDADDKKYRRKTRPSYVYFMSCGEGDSRRVKIGYSHDPKRRARKLQTGNPEIISLIAVVEAGNAVSAKQFERHLHARYKNQRVSGEWFKFKPIHLRYVIDYARENAPIGA